MTEKACSKCGALKPFEAYGRSANSKDGLQPHCRECSKAYGRARRSKPGYLATHYEAVRRWRAANKVKYQAHGRLGRQLAKGKVVKPSRCEDCGEERRLHGHHEDYTKALEVNWVCVDCHERRHHRMRAEPSR